MKWAFVWHWEKKSHPALKGAFAAEDTQIRAIGRLTEEGEDAAIFCIGTAEAPDGRYYSERQSIWYNRAPDPHHLFQAITDFAPDIVVLNHNPNPYNDFLEAISSLQCKKVVFFAATLDYLELLQTFDAYVVHHPFQKELLGTLGYDKSKGVIAPKTADTDTFFPIANAEKKWDCIYPTRGGFGYLKRIELAVEACRLIGKTICLPGAKIPGTLHRDAVSSHGDISHRLPGRVLRLARRFGFLRTSQYPWVTTLPWQTPEEMNRCYNQSRALLITTNDRDVGPRVMPEAAAVDLPMVCCADARACVSHARSLGGWIAQPNPRDIARKVELALRFPRHTHEMLDAAGLDIWVIYRALRLLQERWSAQ